MKNNGIKYKGKKRLKFRHVYVLLMVIVTAGFAWHVFDLLVLTPMNADLALGMRMERIEPLETDWFAAVEEFGAMQDDVDYVTFFWNTGPVVYVSVRIEEGTRPRNARRVARRIVEHFIQVSDDVALQYDIQVVISRGDITEQVEENQAEVIRLANEYNHSFAEATLAWAERYPNQINVDRARANLSQGSRIFSSIAEVVGEEGLQEMIDRLEAIAIVIESDGDEPMPRYPGTHQIPPTNIARFPIWGTWSNDISRIIWN